jgi:transposase
MQVTTIGLDLAKTIFVASGVSSIQVHGITKDGEIVFSRAVRRA